MAALSSCRSSRLSNGETESVKTMIVHDEGESDAGSTPCKDSTLIVRQVPQTGGPTRRLPNISHVSVMCSVHSCPPSPTRASIPFYVDVVFGAMESSPARSGLN